MHGFYPVCNSSGVIVVYLDFPSRQDTKRWGHVRLFLVWHLPFSIEGFAIHCSYYLISFPLLLSNSNLAFRRKADEVTGDQGALPYCQTPAIPFYRQLYVTQDLCFL